MDRVKLEPLQRLELEDARAFHDLPYEHMRRVVGHLLGSSDVITNAGGGLLTMANATYNSTANTIEFESFSYLELTQGGASLAFNKIATPEARIVRFNDSDTDHINEPVDISAHNTNGQSYNIYARWFRIDTDTDARRKWDTSLQSEVAFSPSTRERERIEFAVGSTYPSDSSSDTIGRWVKVYSYKITNSVMSISGFHALEDNGYIRSRFNTPSLPNDDLISLNSTCSYADSVAGFNAISTHNSFTVGVKDVLSMVRGQFARFLYSGSEDDNSYSYTTGDSWLNAPKLSIRGIKDRIASLTSIVDANEIQRLITHARTFTNETNITNLDNKSQRIYATATFSYQHSLSSYTTQFVTHGGSGESDITTGIGLHIDDTDATITSDLISLQPIERARVTSRLVFTFPSSMVGKTVKSINLYFIQQGTYSTGVEGVLNSNGDFKADTTATRLGVPSFIRVLTDNADISTGDFDQVFKIRNESLNLVGSGVGDLSVSSTQPAIILKVNDGFSQVLTQSFRYSINIALEIDNN